MEQPDSTERLTEVSCEISAQTHFDKNLHLIEKVIDTRQQNDFSLDFPEENNAT